MPRRIHCRAVRPPRRSSSCGGGRVYLKPENMQFTGAYKVRGAYYKISTLTDRNAADRRFSPLRRYILPECSARTGSQSQCRPWPSKRGKAMMTLEKFEEASEAVIKVTNRTKLIYSDYFSEMTGGRVYLKPPLRRYILPECSARTGSQSQCRPWPSRQALSG